MTPLLRITALVALIVVTAAISVTVQEPAPLREPRQQLIDSLNRAGVTHLGERRRAVAAVMASYSHHIAALLKPP